MEVKKLRVGPLRTNCYLVASGQEAVIIDPGDDEEIILSEIEKSKVKLKYIINTHYHFDHTNANDDIHAATGAKVFLHQAEKEFADFKVDQWLSDGDIINFGDSNFKVIHTPGHTAGGICLLGNNMIFTGDTLFKNTFGRTDLDGGSEEKMKESLAKLEKIIKPGMHVYPGHGHDYIS